MYKLKLKLLIKSGLSTEEAMRQLLEEYDAKTKQMDATLALCLNRLSKKDIAELFPFERILHQ